MFRLLTLISSLLVTLTPFSSYAEPQHWLAKKGGETELMIIGSVHVGGDKTMYPLPRTVIQHLSQSAGLIIEADVRNSEAWFTHKQPFFLKMF